MSVKEDKNVGFDKIEDLTANSRNIETTVKVVTKKKPRKVLLKRDWSTNRLSEALVGDETGSIYPTLWNDDIDLIEEGQFIEIENAFVKVFRGSMRLDLGRYGRLKIVDEAHFDKVNVKNNLSKMRFKDRSHESERHRNHPLRKRNRKNRRKG